MLKDFTVANLLDLNETIAAELFEGKTYPWEVLPEISDFIMKLGPTLNPSEYECKDGNVWIARSAKVAPTASINGPAIIGKDAEVRHCAFIRGNAIVGEGSVVGNSTELKNVVIFNKVQVPHYNYVGILFWDINPTWEQVLSAPTLSQTRNWSLLKIVMRR